jgi:hypothetical protein
MPAAKSWAQALTDTLQRMVRAWDRFWFSPGDPTTLGLIRIFCGLTVLYVHLAYSYDLQSFFGPHAWIDQPMLQEFLENAPIFPPSSTWEDAAERPPQTPEEEAFQKKWGGNPQQALTKGQYRWSIWYHVTDPRAMWLVHSTFLCCMLLFAVGFCTRIMGVITWIAMLSYIQRAPTGLFGMDNIMNVAVLYLIIGPSGAALSVDRLLRRYWATHQALRKRQPVPAFTAPEPSVSANLALRLMQVHVCIIYAASGLSKLQGGVWWGGTAVWLTMANYEFSPMRVPLYMGLLRLLSEHRWLWELVMTGGTYFTLFFEISFAYLVWTRRLRWTMIVAAVLLHMGIAVFMGLVTFSMMMMVLVLSLVPGQTIRELFWRLGRGPDGLRFAQLEGS